ncbi:MAG: multiple sugar transport system substrate-binding protein [Candidatus Sumerlaeota bacterium]|nr:multiple sugar transport system substrate-binding protein [Candidatus Sumerlaeota bacterium]
MTSIAKRILARATAVLALMAGLLLLAACGNGGERDTNTIEVWHAFNAEETSVFRKIVAEYEADWKKRTGEEIVIDLKYVSYGDMFTKLRTAALGELTPDVAFMDSIKVTDLALGQALMKIDEMPAFKRRYGTIAQAREEFVGASFDSGIVNRKGVVNLYAYPVQTTTVALFWNREMFRRKANELRAAGLDPNRAPRDWDELTAYGKVLTDEAAGVYGFGMHGSMWFNFPIFNMYRMEFVQYDEKGRASSAVNSPNGLAALERLSTLAHSGIEGGAWKRSALGPDAGFINRKYAMVMMGPWMVESFTNAGLDFDISLIPGPTEEEVERLGLEPEYPDLVETWGQLAYSSSNVGGQSGVIMRTCENPEAALEFLDYFTSEPVQRRWASRLGQIPVRRAAWKDLDTSKYPFMPKFMDQLLLARRIPQIPLYGILESNIFTPEVDLLLQQKQTPQQMLDNLEKAMDQNIMVRVNESLD